MPQIPINTQQITKSKQLAKEIADQVQLFINDHASVSVERSVLRLYGVDGIDHNDTPLPNRLVEILQQQGDLNGGISRPFASAMLKSGLNAQQTAEQVEQGQLKLDNIANFSSIELDNREQALALEAIKVMDRSNARKHAKIAKNPLPPQPWRYLIVATGNIYEDCTQAESAAYSGADMIAVIRSTAQSLIDYVPYGPTTEGFGGTYATQANFRIMRDTLDKASIEQGRHIRLVNYASGLCMAEIAACAAFEDLDVLLNDSMYGILFRDINMQRTFIDQHFSRLICARAKILINTGEDNYLTTADAVDNAHTVTASQLINEAMAKNAGLTDDLLGLGHAFEINPEIENAFLYELAHAELARALFPDAPLKYMPPTKYKSTDIFYSHCMDTLFNMASVMTHQGIHLTGILTEALHTPLMQDRYKSISSVNYVFNAARGLGDELEYKQNGFIVKRAQQVLDEAEALLERTKLDGLMQTIEQGAFGDIKRPMEGGKGLEGVFEKGVNYTNPVMDLLEGRS
ncbi:MAG: lysine 5,6-aminomutase subunit alpha [Candidatus Polarisedimenticolaceae bacterium]|nr:lysine 5,6-aminomutase subunit alpha [Candidatus Polarisedimenticolaceae bacterium]